MKPKRAVSKHTEKILMRVLDYLEQEPKRLDMTRWGQIHPDGAETIEICPDGWDGGIEQLLPPCKTTACLAGTVCLATKPGLKFLSDNNAIKPLEGTNYTISFPDETPEVAAQILKISELGSNRLFHFKDWKEMYDSKTDQYVPVGWPKRFSNQYKKAKTPRGRFNATKARVLHFIQTGE